MAFNALISNTDDHPRNHALIAAGSSWQLSPAYDLVPSPSASHERDLAMTIGPAGRRATRQNILSEHRRYRLDRGAAEALVDHVRGVVETRWRDHLRAAGVADRECTLLASAFGCPGFDYGSP